MTTNLVEAVQANPVKQSAQRWRVTIAKPGQGASGFYSADLLESYGPIAFPNKVKAYFRHADPAERDPRDQIGYYENTFWNAELQELQSDLITFKHWEPVIEGIGDNLELSLSCGGEKNAAGEVTALFYHRTNTVDAVGYAGLEGSMVKEQIESLVESARGFNSEKPGTNAVQENGKTMEKEIVEALNGLKDALAPVVAFVKDSEEKAEKSAQVEVDTKAVEAAVAEAIKSFSAQVAEIEAKRDELTPSQIESARAAAEEGKDVKPLLESFIKSNTELRETIGKAPEGRPASSGSSMADIKFNGFGGAR